MKTYKTFRNVNQVINEVSYIAFQVAEISESCLVISDSKIDAEILRNSTPAQRAAGMTIFIREHGTQFAHAEDVAEVRAAWGPQIVRTIEISKERGGLWVVALDCATRYDRNGEPVETTTQSKKITAAQAREVATMAMRCAVLTQSATDIKAAELARREADRLEEIATRAEVADEMAQRRAELEAEAEQTNEGDNTPTEGGQTATESENEPQADNTANGSRLANAKAYAAAAWSWFIGWLVGGASLLACVLVPVVAWLVVQSFAEVPHELTGGDWFALIGGGSLCLVGMPCGWLIFREIYKYNTWAWCLSHARG